MTRSVLVRVYDSNGRPAPGRRVTVWLFQFLASGSLPEKRTDQNGQAEFVFDADSGADLSIYVDGNAKVMRGQIRSDYRVSL